MINIRKGEKEDMPAVLALIKELALYENALEEVKTTVEILQKDGFGERPFFETRVAEIITPEGDTKIVGMCLFYPMYSTWKGKIIYLDDLVVTQSCRRQGVGELLLDALFEHAKAENAQQVRWHVLDWNTPAIKLYEKIGMSFEPEWVTCKIIPSEFKQS